MKKQEQRTVTVNGTPLSFTLTRKSVKNINLRVQRDGSITVSAPPHVPLWRIEQFLTAQTDFIARAKLFWQKRNASLPPALTLTTGEEISIHGKTHTIAVQKGSKRSFSLANGVLTLTVRDTEDPTARATAFAAFLDDEARRTISAAVMRLFPLFSPIPSTPPALIFRTMTSKWGVCRPRQCRITFNRNLVYLPEALVDYVVCHELAHFRHADHSERFWQYLSTIMPDYRARKKALNDYPLPRFEK